MPIADRGTESRRAILSHDTALSAADVDALTKRLQRMDARSPAGPWTFETLTLIAQRPGVVSTELARQIGMERFAFKANVRKLKALGLTVSLETGYRLSPRGKAFLRAIRPKPARRRR
jgi:biotin operon repressor